MSINKRFGQHFLKDKKTKKNIKKIINPKKKDTILEIGPGHGELTKYLINKANFLYLIEIDKKLTKTLRLRFKKIKNIKIYEKNILNININKLEKNKKIRIVGNIPYNISSKIIFYLIKYKKKIKDIHITIQKELADRLIAKEKSKKYGSLSIICRCFFDVEKKLNIDKNSFYPKPKVDSSLIKLTPNKNKLKIKNFKVFNNIIKKAFNQRRKKISNLIKKLNLKIEDNIIDLNKRPDSLNLEEYIRLSNYIYEKNYSLEN